MSQVLPAVGNVISQCSIWFLQVINAVDGFPVWMTAVLVYLSYKFLLRPLFGQAGSDVAHRSYNAFKRRKEK